MVIFLKSWASKNQKQLFFKDVPSSVPLGLAALRGLLAHRCFPCSRTGERGVQVRKAGRSRGRSSPQALEGAVFSGGRGRAAPRCCLLPTDAAVSHTQERAAGVQMQTAEGRRARWVCVLRIFPARPAAERPAPASRSRPCCRNSCWQLHFPLFFLYVRVCFCFLFFFFLSF